MAKNARRRRYRPIPIDIDPVGLAIARATKLTAQQRAPMSEATTRAFEAFRAGQGTERLWADLADAMNVAEALADVNLASDHKGTFSTAQAALSAVCARHERSQSWTLYPAEITALDDACFVHGVQLEHCSQGEMADAIARVKRRVAGALAGSPPKGALVCNPGLLGAPPLEPRGLAPAGPVHDMEN